MDIVELLGAIAALVPAVIAIAFVLALIFVPIVLALTRQELDASWKERSLRVQPRGTGAASSLTSAPQPPRTADPRELGKYREALWVYGELAPALVGVIEAETAMDANLRAKAWFNTFAAQLGHALAIGDDERYRVTVWTIDIRDDKTLLALGHHLTTRPSLPVAGSVAGHTYSTGRPYYARDCANDQIYQPLNDRDKTYRSVYAVPLGGEGAWWGSVTVDATGVDGVDECDQWIIQSLAGLASAAGATWRHERTEQSERAER